MRSNEYQFDNKSQTSPWLPIFTEFLLSTKYRIYKWHDTIKKPIMHIHFKSLGWSLCSGYQLPSLTDLSTQYTMDIAQHKTNNKKGQKKKKSSLDFSWYNLGRRNRSSWMRSARPSSLKRPFALNQVRHKNLYDLPVSPSVGRKLWNAPRHANQPASWML